MSSSERLAGGSVLKARPTDRGADRLCDAPPTVVACPSGNPRPRPHHERLSGQNPSRSAPLQLRARNLLPSVLGVGFRQADDLVMALALIWLAHIGMDRLLGFGLKYDDRFTHTTSAMMGHAPIRRSQPPRPSELMLDLRAVTSPPTKADSRHATLATRDGAVTNPTR